MNAPNILLYLSFGFLASCSLFQVKQGAHILSESLSKSYENFDDTYKKQRSPLGYTGDHTATDCATYFELHSQFDLTESVHNQMVKGEYLICDALKILSISRGVTVQSTLSEVGSVLANQLDLRSFPSSMYRASDENAHTLKRLYPDNVSSAGHKAELNTPDWVFTMELVAIARINDNDTPDWILWIADESKSGNYRSYATLIVYDPAENRPIEAETFLKPLN